MIDLKQNVTVGKTAVGIRRLSLGTAFLGGLLEMVTEERFRETVGQAISLGVNYFDTAPLYGLGVAEQRLGAILSQLPRNTFVLSTKIGRYLRSELPRDSQLEVDDSYDNTWYGVPSRKVIIDFSYDATLMCIEESLSRLGLDRVDIVYIHDTFTPDHFEAAMQGAYRALYRLKSQGVIRAVGVGIGRTDVLVRFARQADFDCFLVAGRYTLLDQEGLAELLPLCVEKKISVILGGVFNSGILANPRQPEARFNYQPAKQEWRARAVRIDEICQRYNIPIKAAALQFPLAHPAVATVLCGATYAHEVTEIADLLQLPIPRALWSDLMAEGLLPTTAPIP